MHTLVRSRRFISLLLCLLILILPGTAGLASPPSPNAPARGEASSDAWQVETVRQVIYPNMMRQLGLAVDANGNPAVAYGFGGGTGSSALLYSWPQDGTWQWRTVDNKVGSVTEASMAFDANGQPHIAYWDTDHGVKYATLVDDTWQVSTLAAYTDSTGNVSLALNTDGQPSIAFYSASSPDLRYAWYDGHSWHNERVDSGSQPSLAMNPYGVPRISYWSANDSLKYAIYASDTWYLTVADATEGVGQHSSLKIDTNGHPHISYFDSTSGSLKYAYNDGSTWHYSAVDAAPSGQYTSLALESGTNPLIAYCGMVNVPQVYYLCGSLKYAYFDGLEWQNITLADGLGVANALALDRAGQPYIASCETSLAYDHAGNYTGSLACQGIQIATTVTTTTLTTPSTLAPSQPLPNVQERGHLGEVPQAEGVRAGEAWQFEVVRQPRRLGSSSSVALDAAGEPHVVFTLKEEQTAALTHAWRQAGVWKFETVDSLPWIDEMNGRNLALDALGNAHIVYGGDQLYYAWYDGSQWHTEVIDPTPGAGRSASLALDGEGHPHVSYVAQGDLVYASYDYDLSAWQMQVADSGGDLSPDFTTSLVLDAAGHPHISYFNPVPGAANGLVRYAYFNGSSWQRSQVGSSQAGFSSIALDSSGLPHIAYSYYYETGAGFDTYALDYATLTGSQWSITTVDSGYQLGGYPSLALNASNHAFLSYLDTQSQQLKFAIKGGGSWQVETVEDLSAIAGGSTSLALSSGNLYCISYTILSQDPPLARLKLACQSDGAMETWLPMVVK
jgi:hypothetical protein